MLANTSSNELSAWMAYDAVVEPLDGGWVHASAIIAGNTNLYIPKGKPRCKYDAFIPKERLPTKLNEDNMKSTLRAAGRRAVANKKSKRRATK